MKNATAGLKQSDIATLIIVVALAMSIAYLIGNALINTPDSRSVMVEQVEPISDTLTPPSERVFVDDFINPTELIEIQNSNNQNPFTSGNN